jgi:hypothetical protein
VIAALDELRRLGEELRQAFADERTAIAALDHGRLEQLATLKRALAERLAELREPALATGSPAVRDLFNAIRAEAHATAMLAATASQSVRALLGYDLSSGYDKRGQQRTTGSMRLLAAY